ncbi:hypothetical protein [Cupriavidus pinatubonensis]|uniref:Uncharacterized protein n=1 Tax=Cupriavidus pinatubonensis TaxID=248026 RepID=A0ABN7YCL1_9BURK|nr:hypothetical protein [Cupriavidus pinatubonensis]CAG9169675.1 hypothetical protein LMG23994_01607 [Cupriavidus pinatubonensis]
MERYLLTVEAAPAGYEVREVFTLIQFTKRLRVTEASASAAECQDALDVLSAAAPDGANAVLGVRLTSTAVSVDGEIYLFLTYLGTPARIVEKDAAD